jgi:hypothetical protein
MITGNAVIHFVVVPSDHCFCARFEKLLFNSCYFLDLPAVLQEAEKKLDLETRNSCLLLGW